MPSSPSLGWQKLQNVYYSLRPCYDNLNWSIDNLYSNFKVAISTQATVLAISSKFVPHPNIIDIYTISGNKIWSIAYNSRPNDHIVDYVFRNEDLCVVLNNGKFRYYNNFKGNFNEYTYTKNLIQLDNIGSSFGSTDADGGFTSEGAAKSYVITNLENNETEEIIQVLEVNVWKEFLILRLINKFIITNLDTLTNYEIPLSAFDSSKIHGFSVMSELDKSIVLLVQYDATVVTFKVETALNSYEFTDQGLTVGPFSSIRASPNGQLISLFNVKSSKIYVISNKYDQVLLEYDTSNESSLPYQIEWCGNDAIILSFKDELKLIGPGQQSISFFYDIVDEEDFDLEQLLKAGQDDLSFTIPILKTESDGIKVFTTSRVEFLSRVSESCINLYQIGSSHPSSILLDCIDKLSQHASKADTNISLLKSDGTLYTAMRDCLEVAQDEFVVVWQKKILRAVSFGKAYSDDLYNADEYLSVLNNIKVLNQLRTPELGIFLTYNEVLEAGWKEILSMLLRRDQHFLALKVIELLKLENYKEYIYSDWCCSKIKKELNMSDIDLFKIVSKKLISLTDDNRNYISVDAISEVAHEEGRTNLCKLLVNLEPSIEKKIQQFLRFEEVELALIKAFQTGDNDIAKIILLHLRDTLSISQFIRVLDQNEQNGSISDLSTEELKKLDINISSDKLFISGDLIGDFWVNSIGKYDVDLLTTYYKQEDKKNELGVYKLKLFLNENSGDSGESYYNNYKARLQKSLSSSKIKRSNKLYQRELEILELKKRLSETFLANFYTEKSLNSILSRLIKMNQIKMCSKVVKDFKIAQEKYWFLVLGTYSKAKEFDRLYEFAVGSDLSDTSNLKSPIGFEPFVEASFANGAPRDHISTYIKNCSSTYTDKIKFYVKNKDYKLAAQEAFKYKNIDILRNLVQAASSQDDDTINTIKGYITKLGY
ncbi:vacuolar sorting protein [Scheffersomyces xylosifermentans]|uniref:vacuolar sorting protein n=1 Tax=Scheffersomyces xylosifermentans TaxID=1304137 RepID=UPI00315D7DE0